MRILLVFFIIYLAALTFPGMLPANRIEPLVFGLPFAFAWVIAWVVLGWIALALRYAADRKERP